jgi:DNA-directed RNA polymerase specialized sigma24 family protein
MTAAKSKALVKPGPVHPIKGPGDIRRAMMADAFDAMELINVLRDGLRATRKSRLCWQPEEGARKEWAVFEDPDHAIRRDYARLIIETLEGLPVKRQEILTKRMDGATSNGNAAAQFKSMLRSPAFRAEVEALIKEANAAGPGEDNPDRNGDA